MDEVVPTAIVFMIWLTVGLLMLVIVVVLVAVIVGAVWSAVLYIRRPDEWEARWGRVSRLPVPPPRPLRRDREDR